MAETAEFTVWNVATGEIYSAGECVVGVKEVPEGHAVHWGERLSEDTYIFDMETGMPRLRETPRALTPEEFSVAISRERQSRLELGFYHDFGDARGIHHIGTTEADMIGWRDVNDVAFKSIARGHIDKQIAIVTDSGPAIVTASEWLDVLDAAEAFRQPIWAASFHLQAMDPHPLDYASDSYWPT